MDDPRYDGATAGCKHFDAHGGPESFPVDRLEYDADVSICISLLGIYYHDTLSN